MKVVFETMLPLPFYAQLHVLYTELCLKYYQGKKKELYLSAHLHISAQQGV